MRFPFSLARSIAAYLVRKQWAGEKRFPLVLMLEPLHACNLTCSGCGRIREYAASAARRMSVAECLDAVDECGAPVVSVCGGEPLIYPELEPLLAGILAREKHVYLCTNGVFLEKKLPQIPVDHRLFLNVHLDGMETTHDAIVERSGVWAAATAGIRAAKAAGHRVYTNTTIYRRTEMYEVAVLCEYLTQLGVDGMMVSPAYGYEAARADDADAGSAIFPTRDEIRAKFRQARKLLAPYRLTASPVYLDFLCGRRELTCAAWANPTRNVLGWKGPCYLITDGHYASYRELVERTTWDDYGPGRDPRCADCLTHCGFEPAAVLQSNRHLRDILRMALWQVIG